MSDSDNAVWLKRSLLLGVVAVALGQMALAGPRGAGRILAGRGRLTGSPRVAVCEYAVTPDATTWEEPLTVQGSGTGVRRAYGGGDDGLDGQVESLARCFDLDESYLRRKMADSGMSLRTFYNLLNQSGLVWGDGSKALPDPRYSVNQQIVELVLGQEDGPFQGFAPDTDDFKQGRRYILSVQPGTIAHYYPFPIGDGDMLNAALGNILSGGTTPLLGGEIAPSHTALGAAAGVFVETSGEDVIVTRALESYLKMRQDGAGVLVQEVPGISPEQRMEVARYAAAQLGKPYDNLALIVGYDAGEGSIYCTELVYRALAQVDIELEFPDSYTVQDTVFGKLLGQDLADELLGRVSPWELRSATVYGQPLVDVFTWFPEDYRVGLLGFKLGAQGLPRAQDQ